MLGSGGGSRTPFTHTPKWHTPLFLEHTLTQRHHRLVASDSETVPHRPVDDDEAQAHHHEGYAQRSKAGSLWGGGGRHSGGVSVQQQQPNQHMNGGRWRRGSSYQDLRSGIHGFLVFGNNTDVEDRGENENEARSWGGTWRDGIKSRSCLKTKWEDFGFTVL